MKSFLLDIFSFSFCYGFLFFASIRSPFQGNKFSIHAEAVEDGRGGDGVKDFFPVGGDEVGGDQGGGHLGSLGDDLENPVGLFFCRDHIAEFVETEDGDLGIVVDEMKKVFGFGQFGGEVKERKEKGLLALEDGLMTEGGGEMGFTDAGRADQDQVGGFFQPLGMDKFQEFIPGDFGVEGPVEVLEPLDSFDAGVAQEAGDAFLFPPLRFCKEKGLQKSLL
jgi:hypothetical protein